MRTDSELIQAVVAGAETHVALPTKPFPYRYMLVASIVLAEAARQIGRAAAGERIRQPRRGLTDESALSHAASA